MKPPWRGGVTISKVIVTFEGELTTEFEVDGQPIPYSARKGRYGKFYKPKRLVEYQSQVAGEALDSLLGLQGEMAGGLEPGRIAVISRFTRKGNKDCDTDNLQKAVQDALTGVVYRDDDQVHAIAAVKGRDDQPSTKIIVMKLDNVKVEVKRGKKKAKGRGR